MCSEIKINCRLDELMDSRNITSEKLAVASGVREMRINQYRKGAMESVSMSEIASINARTDAPPKIDCTVSRELSQFQR